jgi:hypothetical protein
MTFLELDTPDGVRTLKGRAISQLDCLTMRAKQACWPSVQVDASGITREQAALLTSAMVRMGRDCLDWLGGILDADSHTWLEAEYPVHLLPGLCEEVLTAREVPPEAAKKFRVRRES